MAELFADGAEPRFRVAFGRARRGCAPELRPWIQILQRLCEVEGITAEDVAMLEPIARLFPDRARSDDTAASQIFRTEPERFRAFDAIGVFLRRSAQQKPLLLILEDLHTADAASLISCISRTEVADASISMVGTYRPASSIANS